MNSTNNASARMSYDTAKSILYDAWIQSFISAGGTANDCTNWVNNRKLSQGEIRLEVELSTTNNVFTFGVTQNQPNTNNVVFNTENRLTLQDSLIVSEYAIFVGLPASRTDTNWQIRTYGNTVDFTAASAKAIDAGFYSNGAFAVKVNNDQVIPYRGMYNHWYRPETQQTAALGAASPNDEIRGAQDGFVTQEPNLLLIGSKGYIPQIVLPGNLASVDNFTRAILVFRGINAQNSTSIN